MKVFIDLGTSRTAIGVADDRNFVEFPPNARDTQMKGDAAAGWRAWSTFLNGSMRAGTIERDPIHHWIFHSRYCDVAGLAIPIDVEGDAIQLPAGSRVYPPPRGDSVFSSVKEQPNERRAFVGAIRRYVQHLAAKGAQLVIGKSSGVRTWTETGWPAGTEVYNEAVAVVFATLARHDDLFRNAGESVFVLADLGGGFLDICVAERVRIEDGRRTASVVSYGGYPLGVDRVAPRFSREPIQLGERQLGDLISLVINYHLTDYFGREGRESVPAVVLLTGGGFRRLNPSKLLFDPSVEVRTIQHDTKYLTLAGLQAMSEIRAANREDYGDDLTNMSPLSHCQSVLQDFPAWAEWSTPYIDDAKAAVSWYAAIDDLRRRELG
jgi:hypothetical protein